MHAHNCHWATVWTLQEDLNVKYKQNWTSAAETSSSPLFIDAHITEEKIFILTFSDSLFSNSALSDLCLSQGSSSGELEHSADLVWEFDINYVHVNILAWFSKQYWERKWISNVLHAVPYFPHFTTLVASVRKDIVEKIYVAKKFFHKNPKQTAWYHCELIILYYYNLLYSTYIQLISRVLILNSAKSPYSVR